MIIVKLLLLFAGAVGVAITAGFFLTSKERINWLMWVYLVAITAVLTMFGLEMAKESAEYFKHSIVFK